MKPLLSVVDHLVYITPDLQEGVRKLEALLGVTAVIGGQHPKWRTQNALLSLGPQAYLEIMASDGSPTDPEQPRPFGVDGLQDSRLYTWVARSDSLWDTASIAAKEGVDLGEIQSGSRKKPDGTVLQWKMTDLTKDREKGAVPYFIDWGSSPHPATTAPKGCRLERLKIFHPDPERIKAILSKLGIEIPVERGLSSLKATIDSPKGRVVLR